SKTAGETLYLPFKESLVITGKFTAQVTAGKKLFVDGYYGDV
ncbi:unnamed protein product, partial [marine sediment metagenome]